jgi:hypothetical protein
MAKGTGIDLLDKSDRIKTDLETLETLEPANDRTADNFDLVLSEVLHADPGGCMLNKYYTIPVPGSPAYPDELVFARWYFTHDLLVDFFQTPMNEYDKATIDKEVTLKVKFAKREKVKYLPIIGAATIAEIAAAVA